MTPRSPQTPTARQEAPSGRNPFTRRGSIGARAYLLWGLALFAVKWSLDAALVGLLFDATWSPSLYVLPTRWAQVYPTTASWHIALFGAAALPFLWMGVALTLRRLRDAGLAAAWLVLFVMPGINLVFFLLLALAWPSAKHPPERVAVPRASLVDQRIVLHMIAANLIGWTILGSTFVLSVTMLSTYGAALFLGAPFLHGFSVAMWTVPRGFTSGGAIGTALLGVIVGILLLAGCGFEGGACLAMAVPLVVPAVAVGAAVGGLAAEPPPAPRPRLRHTALLPLLAPLAVAVERALAIPVEVHTVVSRVKIAAAPEQVWPLVTEFPSLPRPDEFLFRIGIAYPTAAHIDGEGEGAIRHCTFNTGSFVEPITAWEPPHRLAFDVVDSPQPMIEWSPFERHIDAPHLHGFFRARHGEFRLEPLPGGRTELVGTTWYSHGLQPEGYWQLWSDLMVHAIHARVLDHIQALAEGRR